MNWIEGKNGSLPTPTFNNKELRMIERAQRKIDRGWKKLEDSVSAKVVKLYGQGFVQVRSDRFGFFKFITDERGRDECHS